MDIQIRDLSKTYESKVLFNNINLDIKQGDFIVIKGASGSGKTTLGSIIGGMEAPTTGTVVYSVEKKELYRKYIGFIFQNYGLLDNESIYENLKFAFIGKKDISNKSKVCYEALSAVGLDCELDQKVKVLSGGEKQRLAIARVLIKNPDVIIADEPTGNLDTDNTERVNDLLIQFNQMGKTVILITHKQFEYDNAVYIGL